MSNVQVRNGFISDRLSDYIAEHTTAPDEVRQDLRRVTHEELADRAGMQIGDDQAVFMELLVRSIGARNAIEIGTFTGYSSIAIARGLGPEGRLLCCDVSEEWTAYARRYWRELGLVDRIELKLAPAIETLKALPQDTQVDLVFIDADKPAYLSYYEAALPLVRTNGIILVDNTLQSGRVLDDSNTDSGPQAMRAFNDWIVNDERVTSVILPIGDGLTMIQKH